jgi:glutathione S-transferase
MTAAFRIFGSELSPYSVKVRSLLRFKGIAHEWIVRRPAVEAEFRKFAKLPLIPVVVTPEGEGIQDSTPILEALERRFPEPSIHPEDPALAFLSALVEEFADEWGNKWMFHYRWWRPVDQESAAARITEAMTPELSGEQRAGAVAAVRERMVPRLSFVGSSAQTQGLIEGSFERTLARLEPHLAARPYLFGARPAFGDFGLWGQLYECWTDPTPGGLLRERAPAVCGWIERMLEPRAVGPFEAWSALEPTLLPLLREQVGGLFLPWSDANARALAAGEPRFRVTLAGRPFEQDTQKYHARSLRALRERYAAIPDRRALDPILEAAGCLRWLSADG